ncbi:hypothetical protein F4680DRAFT_454385 [Xylaria scruposa]|nr:hypothetical protein F4680DRAFT_454385 [Xylaria scruposa]
MAGEIFESLLLPDGTMIGPYTYEEYARMLLFSSSFSSSPVWWALGWSLALLVWFSEQKVPAPVVLLLTINVAVFVQARSVGNFVHFWRQAALFAARLAWRTPGVVWGLLFRNRYMQWVLRFWFGFAIGFFRALYELSTGRRWRLTTPPIRGVPGRAAAGGPPPPPVVVSPPPSPPPPPTPPLTLRDARAQRAWQRKARAALQAAREYQRRKAAHDERVAQRTAERDRMESRRLRRDGHPETPDRTGREPHMLRTDLARWWPRVRIALVWLAVIGVVLGFVYYCQSFEPGDECGRFPEALCGGGGVGEFENLQYDDHLLRETVLAGYVAGQVPPRFRYLNDGTKVSLPY